MVVTSILIVGLVGLLLGMGVFLGGIGKVLRPFAGIYVVLLLLGLWLGAVGVFPNFFGFLTAKAWIVALGTGLAVGPVVAGILKM